MKLRNKKNGEIINKIDIKVDTLKPPYRRVYETLSDFIEEWEDYEEPSKTIWQIKDSGELQDFEEDDFSDDYIESSKSIGNYFETEEEAEKAVEKLKAWKRLKDNGISFSLDEDGTKPFIQIHSKKETGTFRLVLSITEDLELLFGGDE